MALDAEVASLLSPYQLQQLTQLQENVEKAETSKEEPTPIADMVRALTRGVDGIPAISDAVSGALGSNRAAREANAELVAESIRNLRSVIDVLSPSVEVTDRSKGNELYAQLRKQADGNGFDPNVMPYVVELLDRWKTARGTSADSSYVKPERLVGFKLERVCLVEGCTHKSETGTDDANSAQHYGVTHLREAHKIELSERAKASLGNADKAAHAELIDAVDKVLHHNVDSIDTKYMRVHRIAS